MLSTHSKDRVSTLPEDKTEKLREYVARLKKNHPTWNATRLYKHAIRRAKKMGITVKF